MRLTCLPGCCSVGVQTNSPSRSRSTTGLIDIRVASALNECGSYTHARIFSGHRLVWPRLRRTIDVPVDETSAKKQKALHYSGHLHGPVSWIAARQIQAVSTYAMQQNKRSTVVGAGSACIVQLRPGLASCEMSFLFNDCQRSRARHARFWRSAACDLHPSMPELGCFVLSLLFEVARKPCIVRLL